MSMNGLKIRCYMDRDECKDCDPTGWCSRFDRMCDEVHIDMIKEDGDE